MKRPVLPMVALALSSTALCLSITNSTIKNARIKDLTGQRDIYADMFQHWHERALQDEETLLTVQDQLNDLMDGTDAVLSGKVELEEAGTFLCTAYCAEKYPHICGTGDGITASGVEITADVTVAADQNLLPYGTVLYIEGVGVRIVQDKGAAVQGRHLDVAVDTHENALNWAGYGEHKVWIVKENSDGME